MIIMISIHTRYLDNIISKINTSISDMGMLSELTMLKTTQSLSQHGLRSSVYLCRIQYRHNTNDGGQQMQHKPLVDLMPGTEKHWTNENYPSTDSSAIPKFLKEQKEEFNRIKDIPQRGKEETPDDYRKRVEQHRQEYLASNPAQVSDEDVKAVFTEWYLRELEHNKWNHFLNQMISTRYSKPYDWDGTDPIPDWTALHGYPTDPSNKWKNRPTQSGRGMWNDDKHLRELTTEGNTSIGDFEVEYTTMMANKFADDQRPPYLPQQLKTLNENKQSGWENLSGAIPEFFNHSQLVRSDYQLDEEELPWLPPNYYDPNIPLPAYRNHEALLTADPRNPKYIPKGTSLEDEKAMMLKQGIKPHKRVQDQTGVAYTPDFDFDLWSEDVNRPLSIINTYGFVPHKKGKSPIIQRVQLPQRQRMLPKSYTPTWDNLIEFNWKSKMTRNQYAPSKSPTFHVIKIAGNGRGCAGLGIGRAASYKDAAKKAEYMAASNMIYVPRYRNHTIAHTLFGKFHRLRCYIVPKPMGYGERGPPIVKAICQAFGIRDFSARFEGKHRISNFNKIRAVWAAFLRATNPTLDCEDRGQRMVEAYPDVDGVSYQLDRGWKHDMRQKGIAELEKHQKMYEDVEGFSQYDITERDLKSLPPWIVDEAPNYWEGGLPDISGYEWRADLIDILNQKGPGGIPPSEEAQIQRLLAQKVDPCDHHFRWMKCMIRVAPNQGLGM